MARNERLMLPVVPFGWRHHSTCSSESVGRDGRGVLWRRGFHFPCLPPRVQQRRLSQVLGRRRVQYAALHVNSPHRAAAMPPAPAIGTTRQTAGIGLR